MTDLLGKEWRQLSYMLMHDYMIVETCMIRDQVDISYLYCAFLIIAQSTKLYNILL
jgi:hypothetical protein